MNQEIVWRKKIDGRDCVVKHIFSNIPQEHEEELNYFELYDFDDWYCGYVQVLPTDIFYENATNRDEDDYVLQNTFNDAIGELTFCGQLFDDGRLYVGFDTNHFNTKPDSVEMVIESVKAMVLDAELLDKNQRRSKENLTTTEQEVAATKFVEIINEALRNKGIPAQITDHALESTSRFNNFKFEVNKESQKTFTELMLDYAKRTTKPE